MANKTFAYLTKRVLVSAMHELGNSNFTVAKNLEVFGKCFRLHGHSYYIEATVRGAIDPDSGLVCDRDFFEDVLEKEVVSKFNGTNLNSHFTSTTGEDLAQEFYHLLKEKLSPLDLVAVRLQETPKKFLRLRARGPSVYLRSIAVCDESSN